MLDQDPLKCKVCVVWLTVMQKEYRWSVAVVKNRDGRSAGVNLSLHKAGKKLRRDIL